MNSKRIYLDGMDWAAYLLNWQSRLTPGQGNHFIIVLETEQEFPADVASALVQSKLEKLFPLLNGSVRRDLLLRPWWRPGSAHSVPVTAEQLLFTSDYSAALEHFCNTPLLPHCGLAVHVVRHKTGSALLFKFSHTLFDARGAEQLLESFRPGGNERLDLPPRTFQPRESLEERLSARLQINSRMKQLRKEGTSIGKNAGESAGIAHRLISLTEEETDALRRRSDSEAGPFMIAPYLLTLSAAHYSNLFPQKAGDFIRVPMILDMRGEAGIPEEAVFFNQWSMISISLKRSVLANTRETADLVRSQLFAGTGEKITQAYRSASRLSRILPPSLLSKLSGTRVKESFVFTFLSAGTLSGEKFAGRRLTNLYHLPSVSPQTGFGVFFNMFNNHLNAVIAYRSGVFAEADVERFAKDLEKDLHGSAANKEVLK